MSNSGMGLHVIIAGNIVHGIRVLGPYKCEDDAERHAENAELDEWCTAPLEALEGDGNG